MGNTLQKQLEAENEQLLTKIAKYYNVLATMFSSQLIILQTIKKIMKNYEGIISQQINTNVPTAPQAAKDFIRYFAMEKIASHFIKLPLPMMTLKASQHAARMKDNTSNKKEERCRWKSYVEETIASTCEDTDTTLPKVNTSIRLDLFHHSQKKLITTTNREEIQLLDLLKNIFSRYTNDNKSVAVGQFFASLAQAENQLRQNMNPETLLNSLKTALTKANDYEQAYYKGRLFGQFEKKNSTFNPLLIEAQSAYDRFSGRMRRRSI